MTKKITNKVVDELKLVAGPTIVDTHTQFADLRKGLGLVDEQVGPVRRAVTAAVEEECEK